MAKNLPLPKVEYDQIQLKGGYDLLTPTLSLPSGAVREAVNFEVSVNGGYTRIPGYERFDGRPAPSAAEFTGIVLDAVANLVVGNTITGPTGTAVVIAIAGTEVTITKVTGTFAVSDALLNGLDPVGTIVDLGAPYTSQQAAQYAQLAANAYRADIGPVPGSGPIRGVVTMGTTVYAWRNTADGTAMQIYKSSATGWDLVTLGWELSFTGGLAAGIAEGDTVTGATSGATGVVARVMVQDSTFAANDAEGRLILSATTGTFQNGENLQVSASTRAVAGGAAAAITLSPGGRVQTVVGNFGGLYGTRIYGCDNVNRGFEFDGTVYAPISTGMTTDQPDNVAVHSSHLFFSFGASLQFSSIAEPYRWSPIFGAGEISMNSKITALLPLQGSNQSPALVVYSLNETNILYGTSSEEFNLTAYSVNMGGNRYTAQRLDTAYVLDDRGVVSMSTSDKFGNFDAATLTYNIRPVVQARRTRATAAGVNREKGQYRVFYNDGYALYMTIVNGQYLGAMPVQFPNPVLVWTEGERADRVEQAFFGSSNGYVYQMDAGTSFDGAPIPYSLLLNYNPSRSPRIRKRYRRASIEMTGTSYAEFDFGYELGYGLPINEQPNAYGYESQFSSAYWDSFIWDAFVWDGKVLAPTEVEMTGTAENVALRFFGESDYIGEFTLNSVILHFSMRRGLR
jgi:hypothetical protein